MKGDLQVKNKETEAKKKEGNLPIELIILPPPLDFLVARIFIHKWNKRCFRLELTNNTSLAATRISSQKKWLSILRNLEPITIPYGLFPCINKEQLLALKKILCNK
jgi:hypothetical protein